MGIVAEQYQEETWGSASAMADDIGSLWDSPVMNGGGSEMDKMMVMMNTAQLMQEMGGGSGAPDLGYTPLGAGSAQACADAMGGDAGDYYTLY